ncbi:MAG: UDP-N-acetylmuramoyl-tripeptide--D-alanyl-D-alanine ligase [bacterium]|nr:UDP-N-acetylmuramoyl-tripeptide--D-alanyl-D-alanine ligase [bacterium]
MLFIQPQELYEHYLACGQKICTDTRKVEKGALFFALKGDNFNANEYAEKAIQLGCSLAVVDDERYAVLPQIVLVNNVLKSLQDLANFHRKKLHIPVLAITGSNGKTTNKELISAVLSQKYKTLFTQGNLNNHIGVPLTLLRIDSTHEFAVIEMGANHQHEIEMLCNIAEPEYGLITNIGKAHLEGFGGIEGVKKGKGELYAFLRSTHGKVFINGDDEVLHDLGLNNDKITYGCRKLFDVIGKDCSKSETVSFKYTTRYGEKDFNKLPEISTQIVGAYNFINCLAAVCVGTYFNVKEEAIRAALENYQPNMNRSQLLKTKRNTIILDAYNANPSSMKAAIESFASYPADKKMVLLGDMFELGEYSAEEHHKIAQLLLTNNLDRCILVGDYFSTTTAHNFLMFRTLSDCRAYLEEANITGTTILIKGSRGMKMETLQEVL